MTLTEGVIQPIRGYARSGNVHIAYQVLGTGPHDMVHVLPFGTPVEVGWELPQIARWWSAIGAFTRSIIFDQRGVGSSDRTDHPPTVEDQVADLRAVIEAVGADDVVLAAYSQASPAGIAYASRYPDRVNKLVLYAATARVMQAPDYPAGKTTSEALEYVTRLREGWGNGGTLDQNQPTVASDAAVREWVARAERTLGSPRMAVKMSQALAAADVREDAKALGVPTLVLHRTEDPAIPVAQGRWLAENIPDARWIELEGADHALYFGDITVAVQEIQGWVTGTFPARRGERILTTLLFTDIANSTQTASAMGDSDWRNLLERHDAEVRRELSHQGGIALNSVGDGFLAEFPTATAAVAAARDPPLRGRFGPRHPGGHPYHRMRAHRLGCRRRRRAHRSPRLFARRASGDPRIPYRRRCPARLRHAAQRPRRLPAQGRTWPLAGVGRGRAAAGRPRADWALRPPVNGNRGPARGSRVG